VNGAAGAEGTGCAKRVLAFAADAALRVVLVVLALLATLALAVAHFPGHQVVAAAFAIGAVYVQIRVKPWWKRAVFTLAGFGAVLVWFSSLEPSNEGDWQVDVSRPPRVTFDGDRVTIRDFRDFDWTSANEANAKWEERTYDLSKLDSAWLALSYWEGNRAICHTILSFGFADGRYLAVSVETRKVVGQEYSSWRGFFKQYTLIYVLADERDVLRVRTNRRDEDMYLYRMNVPRGDERRILELLLHKAEDVSAHGAWYGGIRRNCTTTLTSDVNEALGVSPPFSWKRLANGYVDELAYANGRIANDRPFEEIRAASHITDAARAADKDPDFSRRIREKLPAPAAAPPK
jgi:hypothetical protein